MTTPIPSIPDIVAMTGLKYATVYNRMHAWNGDIQRVIGQRLRRGVTSAYKLQPAQKCRKCQQMMPQRYYSRLCVSCRTMTCEQCGVNFLRRGERPNRFCNVKCQAEYQKSLTGEKAGNWRGGVDERNRKGRQRLRFSLEGKQWRRDVLERDAYTCVKCGFIGQRGKVNRVHAHHIKSFTRHPALRFDVNNGMTLCGPCHSSAHRKPKQGRLFKRLPNRTYKVAA